MSLPLANFSAALEHELKPMAFLLFFTREMIPLSFQIPVGIYIIFSGVFHARKDLGLGPKQRNLLCSLPVSASKTLVKNDPFLDVFLGRKYASFFGANLVWKIGLRRNLFGLILHRAGNIFPNRKTCLDAMFWSLKSFGLCRASLPPRCHLGVQVAAKI
jgi:hypothetical protein